MGVPRARCGTKCCSADPGSRVLRITQQRLDPGSAAHRHSASKTRVNALMALRCARGTRAQKPGNHPRTPLRCMRATACAPRSQTAQGRRRIIQPPAGVTPAALGRPSSRLIEPSGRACCCPPGAGPRPAYRHCLPEPMARARPPLAVACRVAFECPQRLEYGEENTISGPRAWCANRRVRPRCGVRPRLPRP
jgi:hypothetical protein